MSCIKMRRINLTGVETKQAVVMPSKCVKVMVKNMTDGDIYAGIGGVDDVTVDNSVLVKSNCYQVVFINENPDCCRLFDTLTITGSGSGSVECIQVLY